MELSSQVDFSNCTPVNHLWPQLIKTLGVCRAQKAVRQALDLQLMQGDETTAPVLLSQTCGLALVKINLIRQQTGLALQREGIVLIFNLKENSMQLIHGT